MNKKQDSRSWTKSDHIVIIRLAPVIHKATSDPPNGVKHICLLLRCAMLSLDFPSMLLKQVPYLGQKQVVNAKVHRSRYCAENVRLWHL